MSSAPANLSRLSVFFYDCVLFLWRIVTTIFFREIRPRGAWNIPASSPILLAIAPHHNQFMDFVVASEVYRETHRRVEFLVADSSMKHPIIGFFARHISSIPVRRAQDEAKTGSGHVYLSSEDPTIVVGVNTKFNGEVTPRMQVRLPKSTKFATGTVEEVLSDTELRIKPLDVKAVALVSEQVEVSKGKGSKGLEYKILPYIDQKEMFQQVYERLSAGACIGIFPEGGSHDRTDLLPLKAGVASMALGAMANHPGLQVKIVPVGLNYFHPHRFRSRAVVEFGTPLDVPANLVELFKQGGPGKRKASAEVLNMVYDGLKTVTVRAPDYDTLMLVQATRRLYRAPDQHLTLGQVVELNRRFIEGYQRLKDEPRIQKLQHNVAQYNRLLHDLGIRDHQVPKLQKTTTWRTTRLLATRIFLLTIWTLFALPGVILNAPLFVLATYVSRKKAAAALAGSTVKIQGRDVMATWKVIVSGIVMPVLYGFYAFVGTILFHHYYPSSNWVYWAPFAIFCSMPVIAYSALKFGEVGVDTLKSLKPLVAAHLPGQRKLLTQIQEMRARLASELMEDVEEFGPKLWDNFEERRILHPSANPQTSDNEEDHMLSDAMTWLDVNVWGWSRGHVGEGSEEDEDEDAFDDETSAGIKVDTPQAETGLHHRQTQRSPVS